MLPPNEEWYCWKEFSQVEGEEKRLLTPWANPSEYEFPADCLFETIERAVEWKKEYAPCENWFLVKETLQAVKFYPSEEE